MITPIQCCCVTVWTVYVTAITLRAISTASAWNIIDTTTTVTTTRQQRRRGSSSSSLFHDSAWLSNNNNNNNNFQSDINGYSNNMERTTGTSSTPLPTMSLDDAIMNRYSCKKFQRYTTNVTTTATTTTTNNNNNTMAASHADPSVIQRVIECCNISRRTPTAFNTQPYRIVLVTEPEQKIALSKYCLGPNQQKVLDADCTVIFLADKQIVRTLTQFRQFIHNIIIQNQRRPITRRALLKLQFYITLFSSGYPFPRYISSPISFIVRTCFAILNCFIFKWFYPLPSLANAETWSSRQVMMVAMTYMLACTSRGLVTAPMEGKDFLFVAVKKSTIDKIALIVPISLKIFFNSRFFVL
jgi:nitroreductase